MSCQECEALGILFQKHLAQIAVAETDFSAVCNGTRNAEGLQALADGCSGLRCLAAALLDGDGRADGVSPLCVLKTDGLNTLNQMIYVQSCVLGNLLRLFDRADAILGKLFKDLFLSSLV